MVYLLDIVFRTTIYIYMNYRVYIMYIYDDRIYIYAYHIHIYAILLDVFRFRLAMMTSSNGNIFRVTGPLCREFTGQRPVTQSVGVFFDLLLNKQLIKQSWGWWFETASRPLWRHCNDFIFGIVKHSKHISKVSVACRCNFALSFAR